MSLNKKYLITGGAGFIGINLIHKLVPHASHIKIIDNMSMGNLEPIKNLEVEIIIADINDTDVVKSAMKDVEVVIHLAAHTRVIDSIANPVENFHTNVVSTFNLLQASVENNIEKFIFASTGGAIVGDQTPPVNEDMVPRPVSPYGASKLAGEGYCSAFHGAYGLPTVCLRFSNVYGPYSYLKGSVVAHFYKNILSGKQIIVYGDGTQSRDYIYVDDLCEAIMLSIKETNANGEVFQIGSGIETELNELIRILKNIILPSNAEIIYEDFRKGEIYKNFADITKARKLLGFFPKTTLEEGLIKTYKWFNSVTSL